ncbi:MAG: High-affinity branched-chain amino acid transport system permease protein LivH [Alphaproteobacteria bacterium MarineAlpha5_Bin11]|nr:MAG: High-affinity branched-chain amino acid transport system permease protein LivH [Alphaproteobacteria bacterium MarineAlpha5_Bin11]PPR51540.1 MAG: High-affinity branched-chain amino acid transport system permease protein LivH [Alphaproteobacteria bacterium MarineAlpha5_Bin10]|tara:strand:+ start:1691 stop:2713 length:1023 start_codon:yes stop_codon:yes gene_type:complete
MTYLIDVINALALLSNFVIIPAIAYGSQLALGALGITLVFGILRFANFSHGDLMAFGTMITILITWLFQSYGLTLGVFPTALIALPFAIIITALFCVLIEKTVYRFYRLQKSPPVILLIASIGVMFIINAIVRVTIGPNDRRFFDGEKFIIKAGQFKEITGLNEGIAIKSTQVLTLIVTIITLLLLFWFLQKTRTGKSMRAFSDNEDLALLSGVNPDKIVLITWILAAALATIAGTLYGLDKSFKPFTYFMILLPIFASAIVGGIGSPIGAVVGGYVIAFSEITLTYAYKKFFIYLLPENLSPTGMVQLLSTDYKFAISFIILVVVLVLRPSGIFRGKTL